MPTSISFRFLFIGLGLCLLQSAVAAESAGAHLRSRLPPSIRPLTLDEGGLGQVSLTAAATAERFALTDPLVPGDTAWRVVVPQAFRPVWSVVWNGPALASSVTAGDVVIASVWIRADDRGGVTGDVNAYLQATEPKWTQLGRVDAVAEGTWRQVVVAGVAHAPMSAGAVRLSMHLGTMAQTVEIAAPVIANLGPGIDLANLPGNQVDWPGRAVDAPWRSAAAERIRQHRTAPCTVMVVGADGLPRAGVRVAVRQVRSAFAVGSFTGYRILEDTADGQRLRQLYQTEFDRLTIPVYWADWGWEKKADLYTRIAQWAGQHADAVRLHCLIYPGRKFLPKRVHPLLLEDIDAFQREALAQIDRVAAALHGVPVSEIDVANELRDLQEDVARMGPQRVAEWFIRARQHWPQAKLCLNDNNIINSGGVRSGNRDYLVGWVQRLRDLGAAPDVVGVQGHFGEAVTPPERVWQILDELHQRTGCELQITEFDLVTNDRLVQADYTRDLLLALAAHPAVTGITWWGCWAGDQWKPQAAWWEKDWTPRPVVDAVLPLIRSWRTTVDGVTDQDGVVRFAAWLGTVSVEALTADGRTATTSLTVAAPGVPASAKLSVE